MKKTILLLFITLAEIKLSAQTQNVLDKVLPKGQYMSLSDQSVAPKYRYYFIEIRSTGKGEVELAPETGVTYFDIDTMIVSSREVKKNGSVIVNGKKYAGYSAAFNALSAAGLEFVQFANLSIIGGATVMLTGDIRVNYTMWRKRVE